MHLRIAGLAAGVVGLAAGVVPVAISSAPAGIATAATQMAAPMAVKAPRTPAVFPGRRDANTTCTLPDGTPVDFFHCYTPQAIRSAYGVGAIAPITVGGQTQPNYGQGQTIVLVDSYGSPTAAADLQHFHDTFFPSLPNPSFTQVFPLGNPQYHTTDNGKGISGPSGAAGWSGEATLDIEWAYAIAPEANIVLLAVPPSETLGVQGYPNLFKAITQEISATPPGTVFSMSFSSTEQDFGGAAKAQTAKFDQVFQHGLARSDNFFDATGDTGTVNLAKQHHESRTFGYPTVDWPATSPYVVAVGGTQLQHGWIWNPVSDTAFLSTGTFNPQYWQSTTGTGGQAVWNESWAAIGTGGGVSTIYREPSWQKPAGTFGGRAIPDTSWNAAVNGGVDVWISAYPKYNCFKTSGGCWTVYGGTSAATPQTAALVALVNAARHSNGKAAVGFLDPLLYQGVGQNDYTHIGPKHYGSAPKTFTGADVGVTGPVRKSVGDIVDNQMWQSTVPGYPATTGFDLDTGWGTPTAANFVSALTALP